MMEDLKAFCIIYLVTLWVILFSANSKSIQNWKQNLIIWNDISSTVISMFRTAIKYICLIFLLPACLYFWNRNLYGLLTWICYCMMFQYFAWNRTHQLLHLYILSKLKRTALKVHVLWCKTDIYSWNYSEKVSLMDEDSFSIPHLGN